MDSWLSRPRYDPLSLLLSSGVAAIEYFVRRDILEEPVASVETLWELPKVKRIIARQKEGGFWKYPGSNISFRSEGDYNQLETFRILGQLVEKYGLDRRHTAINQAAGFLFSCQTEEGDFRGILRNQYTPYYSAAMMELLIKAGYGEDGRIDRGFEWLLSIRQNDGGWTIPLRTVGAGSDATLKVAFQNPEPIQPDRSKPFSHLVTGVVLRAFAAHERYRRSKEASVAGELLKSRFFQPDRYADRRSADFWEKLTYPFWFTDILSALDSLSLLGFSSNDHQIRAALDWLVEKQGRDGLWKSPYGLARDRDIHLWVSLAVCRVLKRFYG